MSWIHLDDLVGLMMHVLEDDAATGPINGVAPEPVTNRRFTRELSRALRRPAIVPVPALALRIGLGEMSAVLLASQRVRPVVLETIGYTFRFPRLRDALAQICGDLSEELEREQWLPRPPEEVFPFFADPRNLEKITPEFLHFLVLATTAPEVEEGTLIDYRLRLRGFPIRWQSRIEDWSPMRRFVDRQVKGPYTLWHHTHEFEPYDGGTIVRDRVRYAVPLGSLGQLLAGRFVAADLERIFDHRSERMRDIFRESSRTHERKAS
jgi:ligand-binding SRPBCC domain-containing protein